MNKKNTNYRALDALAAFSVGAEGNLESLNPVELNERLRNVGVDPDALAARVAKRLKRLHNELAADAAGQAIRNTASLGLSSLEKRSELAKQNYAFAARTEDQAADEDIDVLFDLTHPAEPEKADE